MDAVWMIAGAAWGCLDRLRSIMRSQRRPTPAPWRSAPKTAATAAARLDLQAVNAEPAGGAEPDGDPLVQPARPIERIQQVLGDGRGERADQLLDTEFLGGPDRPRTLRTRHAV